MRREPARRQLYFLDAVRGHWGIRDTQEHLQEMARSWPHSAITVEETASGAGLVQLLREDQRIDVRGVTPKDDKVINLNGGFARRRFQATARRMVVTS